MELDGNPDGIGRGPRMHFVFLPEYGVKAVFQKEAEAAYKPEIAEAADHFAGRVPKRDGEAIRAYLHGADGGNSGLEQCIEVC